MNAVEMNPAEDKTLLIVEDDRPLRERLARAMEARGFTVAIAESVAEGRARAKESPPAYAVVDLKLDDGNGLDVVMIDAAEYLADHLHEAPVWIVPCLLEETRSWESGSGIYPAVQNMLLAARALESDSNLIVNDPAVL